MSTTAIQKQLPRRAGYTYIEILTVMCTIGILVALLLPAIQAAREASRRGNCGRQLAQILLAVQQYECAFQTYPPGTIHDVGPIRTIPQGYHHNWVSQILPYLEQRNAYFAIDRSVGVYDPIHDRVRSMNHAILRCPSSGAVGPGYCDYAGVHHNTEAPIDVDNNGVFFLNSRVRFQDIPDGVSNTLFIGEKISLVGDLGWFSGTRATLRNTGLGLTGVMGNRPWARELPLDVLQGQPMFQPLPDEEMLELMFGTFPMQMARETAIEGAVMPKFVRPTELPLAVGGFGATHPGGAQFARGDGSVSFVAGSMDALLFSNMGHRADGQMIIMDY